VLATALVGAGLLGVAIEAASDPVAEPPRAEVGGEHVERAVFCAPSPDGSADTSVVLAATTGEAISADVGVDAPEVIEITEGGDLLRRVSGGDALSPVGFGAHLAGGTSQRVTDPATGVGAAPCALRPSTKWFFPAGSSLLGFDERLLVYNPFPDEAVARVRFFTPSGEASKASLADVGVPSGEWEEIEVNEFVKTERLLSASVEAVRGRLVAWRALFVEPESGTSGVGLTLGAPVPSDTWYFPAGFAGDDASETLTILNPSDEEAAVTVSLTRSDKAVAPPSKLVEIPIEATSAQEVSLAEVGALEGATAPLSATLTSTTGVEVVVERTLALTGDTIEGISTDVGASTRASMWFLPPPVVEPSTDTVAIMNPGSRAARVEIELFTRAGSRQPQELREIEVPPGLRVSVDLGRFSEAGPAVALLRSDAGVVAERIAYPESGADVAGEMGIPLTPSEP
jgi:hypothetical protein